MPLCFHLLFPPRAPDGPIPGRLWRRLAVSVLALLFMTCFMIAIRHTGMEGILE
jgi:hypothetical protein